MRELYTDLLDLAREVEDAGLDSIWTTEHHFAPDGYLSAQLPLAVAIAGVTTRLTIAPGLLAPLYHPLRLAEDLAVLEVLSGGRIITGLGTGYRREEFDGLGVPFDESTSRLEETIDILELAGAGETFDYHGQAFHFSNVRISPKRTTPGSLRLVMTGGSEAAASRAARRRAMFMCDPAQTWEEVSRLVAFYDSACLEPGLELPIFNYGFISDADAWAQMRDGFLYLRRTYDAWMGRAMPPSEDPRSYRLILGAKDEVVRQILSARRQFGDRTHFVLRLDYPGMDRLTVGRAIRAYGDVAETVRNLSSAGEPQSSDAGHGWLAEETQRLD